MNFLINRRFGRTRRLPAVHILLCSCAILFAISCKGNTGSATQEAKPTTQPTAPSGANSAIGKGKEEYKATDLPFLVEFSLKQGGSVGSSVGDDGKIHSECGGVSVHGTLSLYKHIIALKTNTVTDDCKIETTDYGGLQIDMQGGAYAGILVTPTQEEQFRKLVQQ